MSEEIIARLRSDLAAAQEAQRQAEAARDAERVARRAAEADAAALSKAIRRYKSEYETKAPFRDPDLLWDARDRMFALATQDHPGAALLSEVAAARPLVDKFIARLNESGRCPVCQATMDVYVAVFYHEDGCALATYEAARKANSDA